MRLALIVASTLAYRIQAIGAVIAEPQMGWIYAIRIITRVTDV
jgi:hypothetical protein